MESHDVSASVLINNYNYAEYLPDAIDSVLAQTYPAKEIIIVDDGSTDDSEAVIRGYAEKDNRIIPVFKENGGQASAYNAGVAAASGGILCFLDSDDEWLPTKLEKVVSAHKHHGFVQHEVLKNGKPNFQIPSGRFDRTRLVREYGHLFLFSPSSALSVSSELAARIFPIPEPELRLCADIFVMLAATYLDGVHTILEPLGIYRMHEQNNWQQRKKCRYDSVLKYYEVHELVNKWLFKQHLSPIPGFNLLMSVRLKKDVLRIESNQSYYVYGTGKSGREVTELIEDEGGEILAFVDSFVENDVGQFLGRKVIGPATLARILKENERVVIASCFIAEILETLENQGIHHSRVDFLPDLFLSESQEKRS
jgi:glycosyltransferase involved in cell wall biosynthesis